MASGNDRRFQIKQILARRHDKQKYYYKVRWEGYSPADDTWEPRKHLPQHIYRAFDEKLACESKKAEAIDSSVATASTEACTLFIGQLNNTTSDGDAKCKVENKTFCDVNLADVDDLDKAMGLSGGDIDGATATIEEARPKNTTSNARTPNTPQRGKNSSVLDMDMGTDTKDSEACTLFIGQPNNTTSEGDAKCKVENKTFCDVNLADVDDLDKAMGLSGGDIDGATATIEEARPKNKTSNARTPNTPQRGKDSSVLDMDMGTDTEDSEACTLFIGQLNNTTSDGDAKCKVENKTFCYVNLADVDDLDKAMGLSGGDIDGATATIEEARPKNKTSNARTPNTPQRGKDSSVLDMAMGTDTEDSGNGDQDETELTKPLSISFSSRELREKLHSLGGLTDIWEGRVKTDRHSKYMLGGMERRCLDQNVPLHSLNEDQEAVVKETLLSMFQEKFVPDKGLDYLMRVILPEAVALLLKQEQEDCLEEDPFAEEGKDDSDADPDFGCDLDVSSTDSEEDDTPEKHSDSKMEDSTDCRSTADKLRGRTSRSRHRSRKEDSIRERRKFPCPIAGCGGEVIYVQRHILQCHPDIPKHEIPSLLKKRKAEGNTTKRSLKKWACPEDNCQWEGDRLDKHLMSKLHKFPRHTAKEKCKTVTQEQTPKRLFSRSNLSAESLAEGFYNWFSSIEGGHYVPDYLEEHKRRERVNQNKKVKQMVKTVLEMTFGSGDFHSSRLVELTEIGRGSASVINRLAEERTWSTVRNYLNSFTHFLDYLESEIPPIVDKETVNATKVRLRGCLHTVAKLSQEELQKRKVKDRKRLVDWALVCSYIDKNMAETLIKEFKEGDADFAMKIQRHILLQIALQNGKRTGTFVDMTVDEVTEAEKEDDGFVILVSEGKTFKVSGAAGVFLSSSEYTLLNDYIQLCRPVLKPKTNQLFCKQNGERTTSGDVHKKLQVAWGEFGQSKKKDVGYISCSLIRKTLISKARKLGVEREAQEQMAIHMDHSIATADRHYDTNTGARLTAKFRSIVQRFSVHESESDDTDSSHADNADGDEDQEFPPSESLFDSGSVRNFDKNQDSRDFRKASSTQNQASLVFGSPFRFGRACIFTDEDSARIKRCCANIIDMGRRKVCVITKSMILGAVKSSGPNFVDILLNYTEEQICTKVRTEIRKVSVC